MERMGREAATKRRAVWRSDSEVRGLRIKVTPRGRRYYQSRWMRAGEAGAMALQTSGSLSKARAEAFKMRSIVERRRDPRDEASYQQAAGVTFGELCVAVTGLSLTLDELGFADMVLVAESAEDQAAIAASVFAGRGLQ